MPGLRGGRGKGAGLLFSKKTRWKSLPSHWRSSLVPRAVHAPHPQRPLSFTGPHPPVSHTAKRMATAASCPSLPLPALPEQARATLPGSGARESTSQKVFNPHKSSGGGSGSDLGMNGGAWEPGSPRHTHTPRDASPMTALCWPLPAPPWTPAPQHSGPTSPQTSGSPPLCCWCPGVLQKERHRTRVRFSSERPGAFRVHSAGSDPRHLPGWGRGLLAEPEVWQFLLRPPSHRGGEGSVCF